MYSNNIYKYDNNRGKYKTLSIWNNIFVFLLMKIIWIDIIHIKNTTPANVFTNTIRNKASKNHIDNDRGGGREGLSLFKRTMRY